MLITYLRSSSFNDHSLCELKYFISYTLGFESKANKPAQKGSIVHKVMELLAHKKLCIQNGEHKFYNSELNKEYSVKNFSLENSIIDAYSYYVKKSQYLDWNRKDFDDCKEWTYKTLNYDNGSFNPLNRNVIQPEWFFDIEITEPWASYEYKLGDKILKGNLAVRGTIDLTTIISDNPKVIEAIDWKGLPIDTPIPTLNGWSTMGELKIGDEIFDKDGNPTKVLAKSKKNKRPCYKITFDDTSTVICDNEHLWTLENNKVINILDLKITDKIAIAKPFITNDIDLPIEPYTLGVWLGDGRNSNGEICSCDKFIFNEIEKRGYKIGPNINKNGACPSRTIYGLMTKLRLNNLLNNKHIPPSYLRASYKQRLELLQGLMDSDGNANPYRKQAVFTNCNKKLSDDVKELLLTLGQRPNQCKTKQTGFGLTVDAYPVHFRPINLNPFLLPRKANKILNWGTGLSHRRLIKKIESIGEQETQCIMVDSPTNTYLCTKNMIPTHNSGKRKSWITDKVKEHEDFQKDFQVRLYHYALANKFPDVESFIFNVFFINHGGPYPAFFGPDDLPITLNMIKDKFLTIKNTEIPSLLRRDDKMKYKCKWCDYGNNNFEICSKMEKEILKIGIDRVTMKYMKENALTNYTGGGRSDVKT